MKTNPNIPFYISNHRTQAMKQSILAISSVVLGTIPVVYGILSSNWLIVAITILIPLSIFFILRENQFSKIKKEIPFAVALLILGLPFYGLLIRKYPDQIWQVFALIISFIFLCTFSSQERILFFQKFRVFILCWFSCIPILLLPIIQSEIVTREDFFFLASILVMPLFFLMPSVIIKTRVGLFSCFRLLMIGGIIQSILIILQAIGIFDHLPGLLGRLDTSQWGGNVFNTSGLIRLPGSFYDCELAAEYLGSMVIISWGSLLAKGNIWPKKISLFCFILSGIAGILTGTRGFIFGALFGILFLMLVNVYVHRYFRYTLLVLVGLAICAILIYLLIPSQIMEGVTMRLDPSQWLNSDNFINRGFFNNWLTLLPEMPFYGFGTGMMAKVLSVSPFLVQSPHSLYFSMLLTFGYPGFLLTVAIICLLIKYSLSPIIHKGYDNGIHWILFMITIYWAVSEIKIEFLRNVFYMELMAFFAGIIYLNYSFSKLTTMRLRKVE